MSASEPPSRSSIELAERRRPPAVGAHEPHGAPSAARPGPRVTPLRAAIALTVAIASDIVSAAFVLVPPLQIATDLLTALLLLLALGWRWLLLPAFIAEAIPGLEIFPFWTPVVASILLFGRIRNPLSRRP